MCKEDDVRTMFYGYLLVIVAGLVLFLVAALEHA